MHVLLTGGTGFIGPYVLDRLVTRGDDVRILALPDTLNRIRHQDRVRIITGSLDNEAALDRATRDIELVYHLGGLTPGHTPAELAIVNEAGTEKLLRASVMNRVRRFVFASSTSVYQDAPLSFLWPITESFALRTHGTDTVNPYAQSKISAEIAIRRAQNLHGLEHVILRSTAVYGRQARWIERLLHQNVGRYGKTLPKEQPSDAMQWTHVNDLADAFVLAGTQSGAANNTFNVAGEETFTLPEVIAAAWQILEGRVSRSGPPGRLPTGGPYQLKFDFSRAQSILGYTPKVKLMRGLQEVLAAMNPSDLLPAPVTGAPC